MSLSNPASAERIEAAKAHLAAKLADRHFSRRPELEARYGAHGRARCRQDAEFHVAHLAQALLLGFPELFSEYLMWAASVLDSRGMPRDDLRADMLELQVLLGKEFPEAEESMRQIFAPALQSLESGHTAPAPAKPLAAAAQRYLDAALHQGPLEASRVVDELVGSGMAIREIYVDVLQAAQHEAGRLWQHNRISVADEHYCTAVTQRVAANLYSGSFTRRGRGAAVVVACVAGELHELGARMVCDLLQLDGFDSDYLGANMPCGAIVDFACMRNVRVVALSASIAPHLWQVRQAIHLVRSQERCRDMKVIVGGNVFSRLPALWRLLGADGWAEDAATAGAEVDRLLS